MGLGDLSDEMGRLSQSKSLALGYHPTSLAATSRDDVVFDRGMAGWRRDLVGRFSADEVGSVLVLKETHLGKSPSYEIIMVE